MDDTAVQAIEAIHEFWFGELDMHGHSPREKEALWFRKSDALDKKIEADFGMLVQQARAGELDHWGESDRGLIALIILLDQFSRNIFRGTAAAFAADDKALALARAAIDSGRHLQLPTTHRVFLYMPLEHCEDLAVQERCVALFAALAEEPGAQVQSFMRFAKAHRDVIRDFGRFPHRNAILGRKSTEAELQYLQENGGF